MGANVALFPNKLCREPDFGTANGLARLVRNRWPTNTLVMIEREWGLSVGEARGVLYAQASRATIDKIKRHRNGGWRVILEVDAQVIGESLQQFIIREQKRLADEQARADEDRRILAQMASRLPAVLGLAAERPARVGVRRTR